MFSSIALKLTTTLALLNLLRARQSVAPLQLTGTGPSNGQTADWRSLAREPQGAQESPDFSEPIGNHTVALGRDAQLSCKIKNLANFRTAWLRVEDKGILTIHNNIITRNYRVGLSNDADGRNFVLTIKNVQPSDRGGYMCQINSVPMKYAIGYLDVLTPPTFDEPSPAAGASEEADSQLSSPPQAAASTQSQAGHPAGPVIVSEGGNVSLSCKANGHPAPLITWRREDNEPILPNGMATAEGLAKVEGSVLQLNSVSRLNSGAYLCIASNGVQPSASKRQLLDVQFSPVIRLPQTELGAQLNQRDLKLVCFVELNPLGSYHWVRLKGGQSPGAETDDLALIEHDELANGDKLEIVIKQLSSEKVQMVLSIRQVERQDFGWYRCIARNSLGIQSNSIRLFELTSSSFSLNSMFRGGARDSQASDLEQQQQQQQQQSQSDQQDSAKTPKQSHANSRAHTRSSWVQRGRQEHSNQLLDLAASSASQAAGASLLISQHLPLLSACILLARLAQIVVYLQM